MRMYDIIKKKRNGSALQKEEIEYFVNGFTRGEIPDYQMSALLMAIYFQKMNKEETAWLTECMAKSGDVIDLHKIKGIKVDKHSTGGVGDKTTLVVAPLVAACGVKVAKMSGRGLGHTGGTIDKLEAIPGFKTTITKDKFFEIVDKIGVCVVGQTANLAPADKKMYALRDVTATVESIPLIAASIMSKKLAAGSDCILLDVKTGSGAFMKTLEDSIELAKTMVNIGESNHKKTIALITDMDNPLGNAIGNSLEVMEAVLTLQGKGPKDFTDVCKEIAANMLVLAGNGEIQNCRRIIEEKLNSLEGYQKLIDMVEAQEGDSTVIKDLSKFESTVYSQDVLAKESGYVTKINTEQCGIASMLLGAGRVTKESTIDYDAGIYLHKKYGDIIHKGEAIATVYTNCKESIEEAVGKIIEAYEIKGQQPKEKTTVLARITAEGLVHDE